jgi:hypothetical protein
MDIVRKFMYINYCCTMKVHDAKSNTIHGVQKSVIWLAKLTINTSEILAEFTKLVRSEIHSVQCTIHNAVILF